MIKVRGKIIEDAEIERDKNNIMEAIFESILSLQGCGKFVYHHIGKGNVYCQEAYLCKDCRPRRQKINNRVKKREIKISKGKFMRGEWVGFFVNKKLVKEIPIGKNKAGVHIFYVPNATQYVNVVIKTYPKEKSTFNVELAPKEAEE